MIRIQRIDRNHPLYEQEVALRQRVLLDPIRFTMADLEEEFPGAEDRYEHIVATVEVSGAPRVIGCVCLLPNYPEKGCGKLAQMAVDPQRQREGVGRRIVTELERRAFGELGLSEVFCHAQAEAVGFYKSLGWEIEGEEFLEAGIPHYKMVYRPGSVEPIEPELSQWEDGET